MSARIIEADNLAGMATLAGEGQLFHLVYMAPPFFTQRDFYFEPPGWRREIESPRELAFSDRWESLEAYVDALKLRCVAARHLLTSDGWMAVHVDPTVSHYVKVMLDGVFGRASFQNEIVWRYRVWPNAQRRFQWSHDIVLLYSRGSEPRWTQLFEPLSASGQQRGGRKQTKTWQPGDGEHEGKSVGYALTEERSPGAMLSDVWELGQLSPTATERTGYPTQKPEKLLEQLVTACTHAGDHVLDAYCGSGTTVDVADRLGRHGVGIDASPVAVRVARARVLGARQRSLLGVLP